MLIAWASIGFTFISIYILYLTSAIGKIWNSSIIESNPRLVGILYISSFWDICVAWSCLRLAIITIKLLNSFKYLFTLYRLYFNIILCIIHIAVRLTSVNIKILYEVTLHYYNIFTNTGLVNVKIFCYGYCMAMRSVRIQFITSRI